MGSNDPTKMRDSPRGERRWRVGFDRDGVVCVLRLCERTCSVVEFVEPRPYGVPEPLK